MRARSRLVLSGLCAAAVLAGCSEGTVSAPEGGSILLDANPPVIGLGEQSEITALVRDGNGNPVRGDVEVLFFTNLGEIDRAARTNAQGLATVTLTAGNTPGTATVRAVAGPNEATINVQFGTRIGGITLEASPPSIPNTGGTSQLVAIVRDSNGNPVEGAPVNFSTDLGTLESEGRVVDTNERGEALDSVTVTEAEASDRSSFTVTARTPGPDGDVLTAPFDIAIQTLAPRAAFRAQAGEAGGNSVQFLNDSTGQAPLSYQWDFGDGMGSTEEDPEHTYAAANNYTVTLTVSNAHGMDEVMEQITVPIPPP